MGADMVWLWGGLGLALQWLSQLPHGVVSPHRPTVADLSRQHQVDLLVQGVTGLHNNNHYSVVGDLLVLQRHLSRPLQHVQSSGFLTQCPNKVGSTGTVYTKGP